jgi:IclR family acetate operon transcriptional repressor
MVQSIDRAVRLLKAFTVDEPEIGVGELSRRVDLPKSTVYRLLSSLEENGLIRQNPETGRYGLGVELISLSNRVLAYADLQRAARPHLRALADTLQETVNLSILDGDQVFNLEQFVAGDRLVMRVGWVGRRMPAHAVSSGRAILAFLPENEINQILDQELQAYTPHTLTDPDKIREELSRIRIHHYSAIFEELEIGLHAVSAPIHNHRDRVIASVSVSGPAYRLPADRIHEIAPMVIATADSVAHELGFSAAKEQERRRVEV